ncbi:glycosyltransferase family 2 protein [Salicibibacter cibi]|uniref:Glycosyltransferase family 2 protein n=1 Tax=Salicibibacter cibi TaxID=2743001 RepID=A0A7T6ZA58_9BACI|nr:glycosyltransferase family A protein [Salicibibacter cibi]QQK79600.1 glycosyltransferase family 2 protein [Salicibibacter cibi]
MISVITCTNRPHMMKQVFENYSGQSLKEKELVLILNNDAMDIKQWLREAKKHPNVSVYQLPEHLSVSECKNFAVKQSNYRYIAKFDDDDYYAPPYLNVVYEAFNKQKKAAIVGKSSIYVYFEKECCLGLLASETENGFVHRVADSTLAFKKDIFPNIRFTNMKVGSDKRFQMDARAKGFAIYSTDHYNHVAIRGGDAHTWHMKDDQLMKMCIEKRYTRDFPSIITMSS